MSAPRDVHAGVQVLSQASPSQLETLKEQLDKLGPAYNYDIEYLNNFLHFKVRPSSQPCFCSQIDRVF